MEDSRQVVTQLFLELVAEKGYTYEEIDAGFYRVQAAYGPIEIRLENIVRDYQRDGDIEGVKAFFQQVLAPVACFASLTAASDGLYVSLEPTSLLNDDVIQHAVADDMSRVLAHFIPEQGRITFITQALLDMWQVDADSVWAIAHANLSKVLQATPLDVKTLGPAQMGFLQADEPYKASLLLSQAMRDKVEAELGWPIHAIAPDRDFVYLLGGDVTAVLENVLNVAQEQYANAQYPLTPSLWRIDDEGACVVEVFEREMP